MRRVASSLTAASFCLVCTLGAVSCLGPTQLTLELRTDVPCANVRGVSITVGPTPETVESARPATTTQSCNADGYIGTIAVTPAAARNGRIAIRAVLGVDVPADQCSPDNKYAGCIVVRRELAFVPHNTLLVPIGFYSVCRNVACTGTSTCKGAEGCVSSVTDLGSPKPVDGGLTASDGGSSVTRCTSPSDCPAIKSTPADCAKPICDNGSCVYLAVDGDGDQDPTSNCVPADANVKLKVGTDCDDSDPTIHGLTPRACGSGACVGKQACDPNDYRKVGACSGASAAAFDCSNGLDNDCDGVRDVDQLAPIVAPDKGNVCANVYRCPKGNVQPNRTLLCRSASTGQYTINCGAITDAQFVGYVPLVSAGTTPAGVAPLFIVNDRSSVYPFGIISVCCPSGSCGGAPLCDANSSCAVTSLNPAP